MKISRGHGCSPLWWNLAYLSFLHQIFLQVLLLALKTQRKSNNSAELSRCISRSQIIFSQCSIIPENSSYGWAKAIFWLRWTLVWHYLLSSCIVEIVESLNNNNKVFSAISTRYNLSLLWNNMTLVYSSLRQSPYPILGFFCIIMLYPTLIASYFLDSLVC